MCPAVSALNIVGYMQRSHHGFQHKCFAWDLPFGVHAHGHGHPGQRWSSKSNFPIHHVHQEGITLSSGSCGVINPPKAPDLSRLNQTHLCLKLDKKDAINQIHGGN